MPLYEYLCQDCDSQAELLVQGPSSRSVRSAAAQIDEAALGGGRSGTRSFGREHAREAGWLLRLGLRLPPALIGPH